MQLLKYLHQIPLDVALRLLIPDREDALQFYEIQFERVIRLRFKFFPSVLTLQFLQALYD